MAGLGAVHERLGKVWRSLGGPIGFSAALCLALGIGAAAAMLGVVDLLFLRPPSGITEPDGLKRVYLHSTIPGVGEVSQSTVSYPVFEEFSSSPLLASSGVFAVRSVSLGRGTEAAHGDAQIVSPSFLELLGVKPSLGRIFSKREGDPAAAARVALVSYEFWKSKLGASRESLGRPLFVGATTYSVIGVMPEGFRGVDLDKIDVWLPLGAAEEYFGRNWWTRRGAIFLQAVVRPRNVSNPRFLEKSLSGLLTAGPEYGGGTLQLQLRPLQQERGPETSATGQVVFWLSGVAWMLLAICCGNMGGVVLLRSVGKSREMRIRASLGASRWELAAVRLKDGMGLAAVSWIGGVLAVHPLYRSIVRSMLGQDVVGEDGWRNLVLGMCVGLLAVSVATVGPSMVLSWREAVLDQGVLVVRPRARMGTSSWSAATCIGQVTLCLSLLAIAGSFGRSAYRVRHQDTGLDASRVLVVMLDRTGRDPDDLAIYERAAERVSRLRGVQNVALGATVPYVNAMAKSLDVPGVERWPQLPTGGPYVNGVTSSFMRTMGTRVIRGRFFTRSEEERGAHVAVVNETMARMFWPGIDALGRCLKVGGLQAPCSEVIGIVEDTRRIAIDEPPAFQYYVPLDRSFRGRALFVRAKSPGRLKGPIRRELLALDPHLPYTDMRTLEELVSPQMRVWDSGFILAGALGGFAVVVALIGLYTLISSAMHQRRKELAIRSAFGADRRELVRIGVRQGLWIAGVGTALGLGLALAIGPRLTPVLYKDSGNNPMTLLGTVVLVALLTVWATALPGLLLRNERLGAALKAEPYGDTET